MSQKSGKEPERKKCLDCKEMFPIKRAWQKYCSSRCCYRAWDKQNPRVKRKEIN